MIGLHAIFESEWIVHRTECRLKSMHLWLATDYKIWFLGYDIKVNEHKMSKYSVILKNVGHKVFRVITFYCCPKSTLLTKYFNIVPSLNW